LFAWSLLAKNRHILFYTKAKCFVQELGVAYWTFWRTVSYLCAVIVTRSDDDSVD